MEFLKKKKKNATPQYNCLFSRLKSFFLLNKSQKCLFLFFERTFFFGIFELRHNKTTIFIK
jgi:hypothetical protein